MSVSAIETFLLPDPESGTICQNFSINLYKFASLVVAVHVAVGTTCYYSCCRKNCVC